MNHCHIVSWLQPLAGQLGIEHVSLRILKGGSVAIRAKGDIHFLSYFIKHVWANFGKFQRSQVDTIKFIGIGYVEKSHRPSKGNWKLFKALKCISGVISYIHLL